MYIHVYVVRARISRGKRGKLVGGGLHEGGGFPICSIIWRGGGLREIPSKIMALACTRGWGGGLHEQVRYVPHIILIRLNNIYFQLTRN